MPVEFSLEGIVKSFAGLTVLSGLTMQVEENRIVAVLGPSGCGKTTLLSILAGLTAPDAGKIQGTSGKEVSFLFQEPRLLDWLTVAGNIEFVLKDKLPSAEMRRTVDSYLTRMNLSEYKNSYPRRMSGGQRQRVAMARALAYPARILLMDEPFKSLDLGLKLNLIREFLNLWSDSPRTVVFVTHDLTEAMLMADEIYLLSGKPTKIRRRFPVGIPRDIRKLDDLDLLKLEREIMTEVLAGEGMNPENA